MQFLRLPWLQFDRDRLARYATDRSHLFVPYVTPKGRPIDYERLLCPKEGDELSDYVFGVLDRLGLTAIDPRNLGFNRMKPGKHIPPHVDYGRTCVINYPVVGDFSATPTVFVTPDDQPIGYVYYDTGDPTLIDTTKRHMVQNTDEERIIFSVSFRGESYEEIARKLEAGRTVMGSQGRDAD